MRDEEGGVYLIVQELEDVYKTTLKKVLNEQGRKQSWLSERTGIDPTWINKLVNGKSIPNVHDAQKISNVVGASIRELWPLDE